MPHLLCQRPVHIQVYSSQAAFKFTPPCGVHLGRPVIAHGSGVGRHFVEVTRDRGHMTRPLRPAAGGGLQRFCLVLEYEGTALRGWQKQGEAGIRTVQGVLLERAAEIFDSSGIDLQGNGRTDAGVHALEYTAHLEVRTALQASEIKAAFNRLLPKDIAVLAVLPVDARFHARHHCLGRSYLYQIAESQMAFMKRYAWSLEDSLDFERMQAAAAIFVGMHDFAAFAEKQEMKKSTQVLVEALQLERVGGLILVRVAASHFLWHLVRRLVGTLAAIGSGRMTTDEAAAMLTTGQSSSIPWMAPAHGLFFEKAFYERQAFHSFATAAPLTPAPRGFVG